MADKPLSITKCYPATKEKGMVTKQESLIPKKVFTLYFSLRILTKNVWKHL